MTNLHQVLADELRSAGLYELIDDPLATDIMVNEDGSVWVDHQERGRYRAAARPAPAVVESLLSLVAALDNGVLTANAPVLEARLPPWGARVEAVLPPLSAAPLVAIRRPPAKPLLLSELVARGTLAPAAADILSDAVADRQTIVISGGVGSGKTTLLNALVLELLDGSPDERLLILEEGARELHAAGSNVNRLLTAPSLRIGMTELLRAALRLNPNRILIGELRGPEALAWLRATNTGHPGSLTTLHANSARQALLRLDSLAQEAGVPAHLPRVVDAVRLVVQMSRTPTGRRVLEIVQVEGLEHERPLTMPLYRTANIHHGDPQCPEPPPR